METTPTRATPYDASEFLGGSDAQAELINDALASGNPAYVAHALGVIAKAIGMSEIARRTGIKRQSLYAALDEEGNPTLETFFSVLRALGIVLQAEGAAAAAGARSKSAKEQRRPADHRTSMRALRPIQSCRRKPESMNSDASQKSAVFMDPSVRRDDEDDLIHVCKSVRSPAAIR